MESRTWNVSGRGWNKAGSLDSSLEWKHLVMTGQPLVQPANSLAHGGGRLPVQDFLGAACIGDVPPLIAGAPIGIRDVGRRPMNLAEQRHQLHQADSVPLAASHVEHVAPARCDS